MEYFNLQNLSLFLYKIIYIYAVVCSGLTGGGVREYPGPAGYAGGGISGIPMTTVSEGALGTLQ